MISSYWLIQIVWSVVTRNVKIGKTGETVGVKNKWGWHLNGPVTKNANISTSLSFVDKNTKHVLFSETDKFNKIANLENKLHSFGDLESLGISENENYVKDFSDIIYRNEDLRYGTSPIVTWPFSPL